MRSFRRILCTTLAFLLLLMLCSICLMELYVRLEPDYYQDGSELAALEGSLDCLILGASHAYRGLDPLVIDGILGTSSYNLSNAMMTMAGRYEMLRLQLARNPVKTVVLEVSYNTMTRNRAEEGPEGDLYLLGRLNRFGDRLHWFFHGFRPSEYPQVYSQMLAEGADTLKQVLLGRPQQKSAERHRGFVPLPSEANSSTGSHVQYHANAIEMKIDPYNVQYLEQILTLCEETGVEVVLLTTPLRESFLTSYAGLDYFYDWYGKLAQTHGLQYYDFNLLRQKRSLFPDETAFAGELHLSGEGAAELSRVFAELEQRRASGEDLSGLFFGSYAEMEAALGFGD